MNIAIVYIARYDEGFKAFKRFIDSYRRYNAGYKHKLFIIFKGFGSFSSAVHIKYMTGIKFYHTYIFDEGYDLGTYKLVAQMPECAEYNIPSFDTMLCLNSHSEILVKDWLAMYVNNFTYKVGLVGATYSNESFYKKWWHNLLFKPFPNPHIRTNAFMISRDTILKVWPRFGFWSKFQCYLFESGRNNLMNRVDNLPLLSVSMCNNFRKGNQEGLVIGDKQTSAFANADIDEKFRLRELAWGTSQ